MDGENPRQHRARLAQCESDRLTAEQGRVCTLSNLAADHVHCQRRHARASARRCTHPGWYQLGTISRDAVSSLSRPGCTAWSNREKDLVTGAADRTADDNAGFDLTAGRLGLPLAAWTRPYPVRITWGTRPPKSPRFRALSPTAEAWLAPFRVIRCGASASSKRRGAFRPATTRIPAPPKVCILRSVGSWPVNPVLTIALQRVHLT